MRKLLVAALAVSVWAQAEVRTITDVMGREVQVDVPVKRAVLTFYYPDYIAVAGAENFDKVVGISRQFWEEFNPGSWKLYAEKMPALKDIADVGYVVSNTFSTEKALALKPDVLVIPEIQYKALSEELPRFEAAGVPVVVVDFNDQSVEKHTKSARIFGELAGTTERADKIAQEYADGMADIAKRIEAANLPKPSIYMEFGDKGPQEYSYTWGNNMWGAIMQAAGGDNVSAPHIEKWGQINPEQLLTAKPEVIIMTGLENKADQQAEIMAMGIGISEDDARKRLAGFMARTGWADLPAVKNNRVYGIYQTASRSLSDLASAQFIAKALYPEAFQDVDPEKTYLDFHRSYLPVVPEGTFFLYPKEK
ncbi:MAG: ABC transporter substrate-binding protein [Cardiobacteriaceae bacterium]|nr:ABC transporter substrate-binding protein [Cardiobacteriaceae bacterium]